MRNRIRRQSEVVCQHQLIKGVSLFSIESTSRVSTVNSQCPPRRTSGSMCRFNFDHRKEVAEQKMTIRCVCENRVIAVSCSFANAASDGVTQEIRTAVADHGYKREMMQSQQLIELIGFLCLVRNPSATKHSIPTVPRAAQRLPGARVSIEIWTFASTSLI